jgi:hypothetical protein
VSIAGIELPGVMYRRFPSKHEVIHGEFLMFKLEICAETVTWPVSMR